jgi:hypothetical protein
VAVPVVPHPPAALPGTLAALERTLDGWHWRTAGRLVAAFQARRRGGVRARRAGTTGASSAGQGTPGELAKAIAQALRAGALDSAVALAERIDSDSDVMSLESSDLTLFLEALLLSGARDKARRLARLRLNALRQDPAGKTILELLELDEGDTWLTRSHPNLLLLSRRIAGSELSADVLAELIPRRLGTWLRTPELHLLFYNALLATEPVRAARFLSRYFELYGLPGCYWDQPAAVCGMLEGLRFRQPAPISTGPAVSILVAAYRASQTLGLALDSLLRQSYRCIEVLVADDASDDGSLEFLRARYGEDPRVRIFRSVRNQGAYNTRNALAARARGELLTFHDADDVALPTRIEQQVQVIQRHGAMASVTNWLRVTPQGQVVFFKNQKASRLSLVSLMLQRRAFDAVGRFRSARFGADLELYEAVRFHFGARNVARIATPQTLGLWSMTSMTRSQGSEALQDGYRSPARRLYSELVFAQYLSETSPPSSRVVDERLRTSGNYAEPSELIEMTR